MKAIHLLLKIAKIKEDIAMAKARKVAKQAADTLKFQGQVMNYAKEYENQILEGGKIGTKVAFLQDADAFRAKLLESSRAMDKQVNDLQLGSKSIMEEAMKAKMKSEGLSKLVDKDMRNEQKKKEKSEEIQFEDLLSARSSAQTGTNNA
jgi:flagellar biosynthesis chaperone FliJ